MSHTGQKPHQFKMLYRKIPIISPGLILVQKAVLIGLFLGGAYFQRSLSLEEILHLRFGGLILFFFFWWGGGGGLLSEFYGILNTNNVTMMETCEKIYS